MPAGEAALYHYAGCIHVHSTYSDGSGDIADLVDAARHNGLDYVIATDHHTLRPLRDGAEGWYGSTLVLFGTEVGRHKGHILALNVRRLPRDRPSDTRVICKQVLRQGGLAFVAHPHAHGNRVLLCRDQSWKSPAMPLVTGLEVWSWMYDWFDGLRWHGSFPLAYWKPERLVTGPLPQTLTLWDQLSALRRCVGIGSLDAHALKRWWLPGVTVFSYRYLFGTIRTYVMAAPPTGNLARDKAALLKALEAGRVYFAHGHSGDPRGFAFWGEASTGALLPGDRAPWDGRPVALRVATPAEGEIHILRDGVIKATIRGQASELAASGPGVYRVEVWRKQRPWIFSNPICLTANAAL